MQEVRSASAIKRIRAPSSPSVRHSLRFRDATEVRARQTLGQVSRRLATGVSRTPANARTGVRAGPIAEQESEAPRWQRSRRAPRPRLRKARRPRAPASPILGAEVLQLARAAIANVRPGMQCRSAPCPNSPARRRIVPMGPGINRQSIAIRAAGSKNKSTNRLINIAAGEWIDGVFMPRNAHGIGRALPMMA